MLTASLRIQSEVRMRENTDQNNSEYRHISCGDSLLKCHGWVYLLIQFNKNFTLLQHKFNVPTLKNSTNQNQMQNMKLSFYCFYGNSIICSFAAYRGVHSSVSIITFLTRFFSCYAINFYWKICKHVCMRLKLHLSVCWLQDITIELKSVQSGLWYC